MRDGEQLIPVSESEFAHDNVFGYKHSHLVDYIKEKGGNPDDYDIVNAQNYEELNAFRDSLFAAIEGEECSVVIRSSSSLPRSLSGIPDKPFLTRRDLGIQTYGTGCGALPDHDVQEEVLHGGIENLLDLMVKTMDLVHEEHVTLLEVGEDGGEVSRALDGGT
jgi:hypothetical protein